MWAALNTVGSLLLLSHITRRAWMEEDSKSHFSVGRQQFRMLLRVSYQTAILTSLGYTLEKWPKNLFTTFCSQLSLFTKITSQFCKLWLDQEKKEDWVTLGWCCLLILCFLCLPIHLTTCCLPHGFLTLLSSPPPTVEIWTVSSLGVGTLCFPYSFKF